jgi:Fur family peroxide stress response transcriptional regulator
MRNKLHDKVENQLEQLKAVARKAGVKLTHQRLEIFRELASTETHPDADAIYRAVRPRMPTLSLDTVYRTLWMLHDLGLITTLGPQRDRIRFDANLEQHHHFVCIRCGLVRDFESEALARLPLPESLAALGAVRDAHVEVRGTCGACQRAEPAPGPAPWVPSVPVPEARQTRSKP